MRRLRSRLPPLSSIVTFEAAARHLSFTRAGEELFISREAVSRSVKDLEDRLGVPLFVRRHRALALTADGRALLEGASKGLEAIVEAVEGLGRAKRTHHLTVGATVALAHFWLTPRLPRFRALHPGIELHLRASDAPLDLAELDVAVRYGDGRWPGADAVHLFDTETFPVCAAAYLKTAPRLRAPADLIGHTLLNLDGEAHADEDWTWWLGASGVRAAARPTIVGFDSYADVIQAAREGQGVALGFTHIIGDLIERGELVRPLPDVLRKGLGVYAIRPARREKSPEAMKLLDWLVAEAPSRDVNITQK